MAIEYLYTINVFDDGNAKYQYYPNKWMIIDTMYGGDKVRLQNKINSEIIINSISRWKIF